MDTLAVQLTLPLAGCVEDLHLQVSAPCWAHRQKSRIRTIRLSKIKLEAIPIGNGLLFGCSARFTAVKGPKAPKNVRNSKRAPTGSRRNVMIQNVLSGETRNRLKAPGERTHPHSASLEGAVRIPTFEQPLADGVFRNLSNESIGLS